MAPRPPESRAQFVARLRAWAAAPAAAFLGFGAPHHRHGVVVEDGALRVRALQLDVAQLEAHRAAGRPFTPEAAEDLSAPTGAVVVEGRDVDGLVAALERLPWPLR